jgi:hypothetical protein
MKPILALATDMSSFVKSFFWYEDRTLIVNFKGGKSFRYHGVPKVIVEDFQKADSFGKFLHENLKNKYEGEPVEDKDFDVGTEMKLLSAILND